MVLFKKRKSGYILTLGGMCMVLFVFTIISFCKYGPYHTPDTVNYFRIAQGIETTELETYSPLYPAILYIAEEFLHLSIFDAAALLIVFIFIGCLILIYKLSKTICPGNSLILFYPMAISFLAWWSFRVMGTAHADGLMYMLLIAWLYVLSLILRNQKPMGFWQLGIIGAVMVWTKLNAVFLLPLVLIFYFLTKDKKWRIPVCCILLSTGAYFYFFQKNILRVNVEAGYHENAGFSDHVSIFFNNISGLFKVSLGYFISDLATSNIPTILAFLMGCLLITFCLIKVFRNPSNNFSYMLAWSALTYMILFFCFQQWILYEEINYRTLFPYLLALGWAFWIWLSAKKYHRITLLASFLIFSHTLLGHLYLWQRTDVASLFEVKKLASSSLPQKLSLLLSESDKQIFTDSPEIAAYLLMDVDVHHLDPESLFIRGKRRFLSEEQRKTNLHNSLEMVRSGKAILILFEKKTYTEHLTPSEGLNFTQSGPALIVFKE